MAIQLPRITEYFSSLVQFNFCKLFLDAKFLNLRESYSDTAYEYEIIHFSPKNTVIKNFSNYCHHKLSIFPNSYTLAAWDKVPFLCAQNKDWIKTETCVEDSKFPTGMNRMY